MSGRRGSSARAETIEEDPYYTEPDYTEPDYIEPDYIEDEGEYDEKTVRRKEEERPVSDGAYYDTSTGKRRVEETGPSKDQMRREFLAKIIIGSLVFYSVLATVLLIVGFSRKCPDCTSESGATSKAPQVFQTTTSTAKTVTSSNTPTTTSHT